MNKEGFKKKCLYDFMARADKKKFGRANFGRIIEYAYLTGGTHCLYTLLDSHKKEPFQSVDELIGELQTYFLDIGNDVIRHHYKKMAPLNLEEMLTFMEK